MKKWIVFFGILVMAAVPLSADVVRIILRSPADVSISPTVMQQFQCRLSTVFDQQQGRDVLCIGYALKPGTEKNAVLSIAIPELRDRKWQSVEKICVVLRGGIGHIRFPIYDCDGEVFVAQGFFSPGPNWATYTANYTNISPKSCHIWGGKNKKFRNKRPDAPVAAGPFELLVRPGHIAAQLRKTMFLHQLKATKEELARGMDPEQLYLAAIEVHGTPYGKKQSAAADVPEKTAPSHLLTFLEIGTSVPLKSGNREKLFFTLKNTGKQTRKYTVSGVSSRLLTNHTENYQDTVEIASGAEKKLEMPFRFAENGVYEVKLELNDGECSFSHQTFVNVWTPVGNNWTDTPERFFGTHAALDMFYRQFGRYREQDYQNMQDAGIQFLRNTLRWSAIQPKKNGPYQWDQYDKIFRACLKHGITPYWMLDHAPKWAWKDPEMAKKAPGYMALAPDNVLYAAFAAKAAERYGIGAIYQIWNEPYANHFYWGGTPQTYADMLKKAYAAIKKVNPRAVVCAGACWDEVFPMVQGAFDIWPFHNHGKAETMHASIGKHRKMLESISGKSMGVFSADECGLSVDPLVGGSEYVKASEVVKKAVISRANGLAAHVFFVWRGHPDAPLDRRDNYPFMDEKNRCRPVIPAICNLIAHLKCTKTEKIYRIPGTAEADVFSRKGEKIIVFWRSEIAKGQIITIRFASPVKRTIANLYGSREELRIAEKTFTRIMTPEPVYLTVPGNAVIEDIRFTSMLHLPAQCILKNGAAQSRVTAEVFNPFPDTLNGFFRVKGNASWQPVSAEKQIRAAPGKSQETTILFRSAGKNRPVSYVDYSFESPEKNIRIEGSIKFVSCMPLTRRETLIADICTKENMLELRSGDVDPDMFWQGEKDLSAKIFGSWNPENLELKILVRDNQHFQNFEDSVLWGGDSVQLAFRTPDYSQIGFALTNRGKLTYTQWAGKYSVPPECRVTRTGEITAYTVRIPWKALNLVPEKGTAFQMSVLVNDNDGRCRKVLLEWGGGIHGMGSITPMNPMILE